MPTVKVIPGKLSYVMTRGDDFAAQYTIQEGDPLAPVDVSARTYTSQIRTTPDATEVTATFSVDMTDAALGIVVIRLADTVTNDLSGTYFWDLQQDSAGVIRTLLGGNFTVLDDVTRAA